MRAALYARYSSDRQNERSIEDQLTVCRRHAESRGWTVVATFSDAAISGAAMANRPGLQALMAAAVGGAFDVVLVEDEDRLARNLEHQAHIFNRLGYLGVAIATLASEKIGILEVGLKGVMAELYLVTLSQKTSRGMRANAEKGLATGSRTYGYRSQPGGTMAIVEEEAQIVREIFERFNAGERGRAIAADLNARSVPGPRGGRWNASTINGSRQRGNGILHTELYAGVKVWNRMDVVKDRETGKRLPRMKPVAEWKRTPAPELATISAEAWAAAHGRKRAERPLAWRAVAARSQGVFSGLLKCGCCGASYTSYSKTRLVCAAHREQGPAVCANAAMPLRGPIEARILDALKTRLASPEAVEVFMQAYRDASVAEARRAAARRRPLEQRIAELRRREDRIVDAYASGAAPMSSLAKAKEHEAERLRLEADLAVLDQETPVVTVHPAAPARYAELVTDLQEHLATAAADPQERRLIDALRDLVIRVDITPDAGARDGFAVNLVGDLARFMTPDPRVGSQVVAGARYEHGPNGDIPMPIAA